jgi:hypothetical protein
MSPILTIEPPERLACVLSDIDRCLSKSSGTLQGSENKTTTKIFPPKKQQQKQ